MLLHWFYWCDYCTTHVLEQLILKYNQADKNVVSNVLRKDPIFVRNDFARGEMLLFFLDNFLVGC